VQIDDPGSVSIDKANQQPRRIVLGSRRYRMAANPRLPLDRAEVLDTEGFGNQQRNE
jgi:hypothetical protein